jgi:hypothetical protein
MSMETVSLSTRRQSTILPTLTLEIPYAFLDDNSFRELVSLSNLLTKTSGSDGFLLTWTNTALLLSWTMDAFPLRQTHSVSVVGS